MGVVLLLLRKRLAAGVLLISFLSMIVTSIHNFFLSNGLEVMGSTALIFAVLIFKMPGVDRFFMVVNDVIISLLDSTKDGASFVFGHL